MAFDKKIILGIARFQTPLLTGILTFITHLGDSGIIWIAIGVAYLIGKRDKKTGTKVILALLFSLLFTNIILKNAVMRPRPFTSLGYTPLVEETGWSFPSGHTSSSFAAAIVLLINRKWRGIPYLLLAGVIAFSRLYLQVHYPLDILGGCVMGCLSALCSNYILNRPYITFFDNLQDKSDKEDETKATR